MSLRRLAPLLALLVSLTLPIPTPQAQFEARALLPVPGDLYSLMAGDFNRDGIPDVAAVNSGGGVEILLGNGDGTFRMGANYGGRGVPLRCHRQPSEQRNPRPGSFRKRVLPI